MPSALISAVHRPTVLVVDDVPENIDLLVDILRDAYQIKAALGGEKALMIALSDAPPDLILLDVMMPGINGHEVCRRVKEDAAGTHIPIIFITANEDPKEEEFGLSLGAADYITKPFNPAIVLARVKIHIALHDKERALKQQIASTNTANAELKQALEELGTAYEKLARAERLAAIGAMVAGVAHELNTPIGNSILTATTLHDRSTTFERVMQSGIKRSELADYIADTLQASEMLTNNLGRLSDLVHSFKRLAVSETRSPRRVLGLADTIEESTAQLADVFQEKKVTLRTEIPRNLSMDSFPEAVVEVFNHLIQNALLHGFDRTPGGEIAIVATTGAATATEAEWITITVQDNGDGIASMHLPRIFDPFFTTRMGTGSNGLGLNIVHNLVTNVLGGSIEAQAEPGCTRFTLRLPRVAPHVSQEGMQT